MKLGHLWLLVRMIGVGSLIHKIACVSILIKLNHITEKKGDVRMDKHFSKMYGNKG